MPDTSTKTSIHSFIIPYFIQTDPKGIVHAVCDKMDALLSYPGKLDYVGQPLSAIFSRISNDQLLFISNIEENGFPDSFELDVNFNWVDIAPIRWICSRISGDMQKMNGWQLTGIPMSSSVGSMQDITEKKNLEKKLLKQQLIKQKQIAQAMFHAQEKERADIGEKLHDSVSQILSTCKLYLDLARTNSKKRLSLIDLCVEMLNNSINEVRGISKALVPRSISDLGLVASINDLLEHIRANHSIHVEFYSLGNFDQEIDDQQKLVIFRTVQEQVNNVLKHAQARNLIIELLVNKGERVIELNITDDGIGFDPKKIKGIGLSNIVSRTDLFNGKVNMVTAPEKGCKLSIHLPINYL